MSQCQNRSMECPQCGVKNDTTVWSSVNSSIDPSAKQRLLNGNLNYFICPECGCESEIESDILYHDMEKKLMVWLRYGDDDGKTVIDPVSKEMANNILGKDYQLRNVKSRRQLLEKIIVCDEDLDDRVIEIQKLFIRMREPDILNVSTDLFVCTGCQDDNLEFVYYNQDNKNFELVSIQMQNYLKSDDILSAAANEWANELGWLTVDYEYAAKMIVTLTPASPITEVNLHNRPDGSLIYTDSEGVIHEKIIDTRLLREFEKAGKIVCLSEDGACQVKYKDLCNAQKLAVQERDNSCARELSFSLFTSIVSAAINDYAWRLIGFKRRPRRGSIWERFIKTGLIELENFCMRELAIIVYAEAAKAVLRRYTRSMANQVLALCLESIVDSPDGIYKLWQCFGFSTRSEAIDYFAIGTTCYLNANKDLPIIMFKRASPFLYNEKWQSRLMLGCCRMFNDFGMQNIFDNTTQVLDGFTFQGSTINADIRDPIYLQYVEQFPDMLS